MHEMSLAEGIVQLLEDQARAQDFSRVKQVWLSIGELAGVEVAFPFLHDDVVAFSAGLTPQQKLNGTQLRWFFKEALRGFLPDAIITKQKHGFGLPFGVWLQSHRQLQQLASDSLHDLKARRIVRGEFIEQLVGQHLQEHAGYHGTMVWVLMMLEQWFRQHRI